MILKIDLKKVENLAVILLRFAIALIFLWFGGLKIIGFNPVYDIVYSTFPIFASYEGNIVLGIIEVVIGIGLVFDLLPIVIHGALLTHLAGTMMTFIVAPDLMFFPSFPILTLEGEFVLKNIILAMSGIVVLLHESRRSKIFLGFGKL